MRSTRRKYMAGTAAMITVTPMGEARENPGEGNGPPDETPPVETPPREGESVMELEADPIKPVGIGVIGLGNRGPMMTQIAAEIAENAEPECEVKAICDLVEERVQDTASTLQDYGMDPATYSAGVSEDEWDGTEEWREYDVDKMADSGWKEMVQRDDLNLVLVFTHHQAHAPMCEYIMDQGKHVACEVPIATTIEECWDLVNASERNQKHCMQLENYNFREEEMWVLNMVQHGIFGDITYGRGGYIHNQTGSFMHDYGPPVNWRSRMYLEQKGDHYPTHGLGPIAWYMKLLRGDRMDHLVAQESPEANFSKYAMNELDPEHEFYGRDDWANGDTTRSLIQTDKGKSIEIQLDVKTKRNFVNLNTLAGTDAYHEHVNDGGSNLSIGDFGYDFVDDDTYEDYWDEYRHPVWEELGDQAEGHGHGGGDYIEIYRLVDALNEGRPVDQNVYDSVHWAAVQPLSRISINNGSKPVKFPDFTRGEWETDRDLPINKYS